MKCSKTALFITAAFVMFAAVSKAENNNQVIRILPTDTDEIIFKKHLQLCKLQNSINRQTYQKISNLSTLISNCNYAINTIVENNAGRIKNQISQIENNIKYSQRDLRYKEKRVNDLNKKIKTFKVDKAKQEKLAKLDAENKKLLAEMRNIEQPFRSNERKFLDKMNVGKQNAELSELLRPLIATDTTVDGGKITSKYFSASFSTAFVSNNWYINNKKIAWAHIRIRPVPDRLNAKDKLAGKYPVSSQNDSSIWFWVGEYQVCFVVEDQKYKNADKIKELAQKLLKLSDLEKSSDSDVIKKSVIAYEFIEINRKKRRAATSKLQQQDYKLRREISALEREGYYSPETVEKFKRDLERAEAVYDSEQKLIAFFSELMKILKSPADQRKSAVPKLKDQVSGMRQQIIEACLKVKARRTAVISDADFNIANARYQSIVKKIIRMPAGKELTVVNQVTTDAWFGVPLRNIYWNLNLTSENNQNTIPVCQGIIVPYTNQTAKGMLDNKYIIYEHNDSYITLGVGPWVVSLFERSSIFHGKDFLSKAVKELYDLDRIAALSKDAVTE